MPYLKNITRDYVRVGSAKDTGEPIRLEPKEIVDHVDKETKERTIRQGENVIPISEEVLKTPSVRRSLGRLFVEIDEEEYETRIEEIYDRSNTPGAFALGPDGEKVPIVFEQPAPSIVTPLDELGLATVAGASHGHKSNPITGGN